MEGKKLIKVRWSFLYGHNFKGAEKTQARRIFLEADVMLIIFISVMIV